ncbi:MAG: cation-translocating P-type ATPase [Cyclobacteriaceae bacterium]
MKPWFACSSEEVIRALNSSPSAGLSLTEVESRIKSNGYNRIPEPRGKSLAYIFFHQFLSPLIYVLMAAGVVSWVAGEWQDGTFIFFIIILNAVLGTYQEWRAEESAAALRSMIRMTARVIRQSQIQLIESWQLVPGDIVLLEPGMRVPADVRLIEAQALSVDEALLTGESMAVQKDTVLLLDETAALGDQRNMAFASTTIQKGRGKGVVTTTGIQTEIGKIANSLTQAVAESPPLVARMQVFARRISWLVLLACILLGIIGWWRGMPWNELFFFLVAVGVSAIPEGLPVALTVALSIGTRAMAKRQVIVRRLPAVEGLGSCTWIASDKTGTLTVDEQTVSVIWLPGAKLEVTGAGYNGDGTIRHADGRPLLPGDKMLEHFLQCALVSSEGALARNDGQWTHSGDAVDVALHAAVFKSGADPAGLMKDTIREQLFPYESERKSSAAFFRRNGTRLYACKGALEVIGPRLAQQDQLAAADDVAVLAGEGYRVLAVAFAEVNEATMEANLPTLTLAGLVGLLDPLRPEAREAVASCHRAGIQVAMVTGDHPITARSIARQLNIITRDDQVITGRELAEWQASGGDWVSRIRDKRVFARVNPLQKMAIVIALKASGHFVAVTGDGANDAPALREAHIGVAMGSGTDLTKSSADIILADNNFASIVAGVEEGRITYNNLRKIIYMLLSTGLAEIITVALAMITRLPLPFLAIQLLWLNLVTNGIQDISLAFERSDRDVLNQPPRKPGESIFDRLMIQELALAGLVTAALCYGTWYYLIVIAQVSEIQARSMVLMLMVLIQNFHVLNCRSEIQSVFAIPVSANYLAVISIFVAQGLHLAVSYWPGMANLLGIEPIPWNNWFTFLALSLSIVVVMEIFKGIQRRHIRTKQLPA